jgi:hypothetical protein
MRYRQALILLLAAAAFAADSESEALLKRATARVVANFKSINSYMCIETVQRDYYRPRAATLPRDCAVLMQQRKQPTLDMQLVHTVRDRLRLEVAVSSRGEIHAWPGASAFNDSGIDHIVREGPIGTGAFGTLLSLIFMQDVRRFGFSGATARDGLRRFHYNFSVPAVDSHYRIRSIDGSAWYNAAYDGLLLVDAATAEPVQLGVVTKDLPPAAGVCQTATTLDYQRGAIDGQEILLPAVARQSFVNSDAIETQNTITFSNCRQYSSESNITFGPPDESAPAGKPAAKPMPTSIPASLPFAFELTSPIDSDTAAAGDRFTGRLSAPLRDGKTLVAPKGARIEGRISDVEIGFYPKKAVVLGLIPESIEMRGVKAPFAARLDIRRDIVTKEQKKRKGLEFLLPRPGEYPHLMRFDGGHAILPKGFLSNWLTAK